MILRRQLVQLPDLRPHFWLRFRLFHRYRSFFDEYDDWLPTFPELALPQLTADELIKNARQMKSKAAGTDGWQASALLELPKVAWDQLISLFLLAEEVGVSWLKRKAAPPW